jgi:spore coat protein A, manganese oxidase
MLTRRTMISMTGLAATTTLATPWALTRARQPDDGHDAHVGHDSHGQGLPMTRPEDAGHRPAIQKFRRPLPLLPDARPLRRSSTGDVYVSQIAPVSAGIFPRFRTPAFGYFGQWIPPVIRARQGRRTTVVQHNHTRIPVTVHLHGGITAARYDGQMTRTIPPGRLQQYVYENDQPAAALWMHDHSHGTEAPNVYQGMASPYIITSDEEESLGLPSGDFEIPLMLRDADFGSRGQFVFTMDDTEHRSTIMVNGRPWPFLDVKRRKYRFRIINASNMRFFVLGLSTGSPVTVIGGDCGLIERPAPSPVVVLSPGERSDVVIDFSSFEEGSTVDLVNYMGPGPMDDVGSVMRFRVGSAVKDDSVVPDRLTTLSTLPRPTASRRFSLLSSEPGVLPMTGSINGRSFTMDDMHRVDLRIPFGTTEDWEIVNANATVPHNFHTHLAHFRVIDRDGTAVGPEESGFKDTVQVFPGQKVTLRMTFNRYRGVYPFHCHMLDHSAMGMMAQFQVV